MDDEFDVPCYDEYFFYVPERRVWDEFMKLFSNLDCHDDYDILDYIVLTEE